MQIWNVNKSTITFSSPSDKVCTYFIYSADKTN